MVAVAEPSTPRSRSLVDDSVENEVWHGHVSLGSLTSKIASARSVGTVLEWCTVSPCHVGSFSIFLANHDVELYSSAFAHAPRYLLQIVPRYPRGCRSD